MGPYSHYVFAAKLEPSLQPENRKEYYWGAVAPDIRYLANLPRDRTHLEQDRLKDLLSGYSYLRSFLIGYRVHVLIDQIDVSQIIGAAFPLNLLKKVVCKSISPQRMTMLVEMHYLQSKIVGEPLSGNHNEVLSDLGITSQQTRVYQQALREYFEARSFEAAVAAFQKIGWIQYTRVEKYLSAYRALQRQKILKAAFTLGIKNAKLDSRVIEHVRSSILG